MNQERAFAIIAIFLVTSFLGFACAESRQEAGGQQDAEGMQLFEGIRSGNVGKVEQYLEDGGSPDRKIADVSLIGWAVRVGQPDIVQLLVEAGASIDWCEGRRGLLHSAVSSGSILSATYLLRKIDQIPGVQCSLASSRAIAHGPSQDPAQVDEESLIAFYEELTRLDIDLNVVSSHETTALDAAYRNDRKSLAVFLACSGVERGNPGGAYFYKVERVNARVRIWNVTWEDERQEVWHEGECR